MDELFIQRSCLTLSPNTMSELGFLAQVEAWHWLTLMFTLIAFEALGIGGFFIGMIGAAFISTLLNWLGFGWQFQFVSFGALSVIFSYAYWIGFRRFNNKREDSVPLNDRFTSMLGKHGKVTEVKAPGIVKAQFGDTLWNCEVDDAVVQGDLLEVTGNNGTTLLVKKAT